MAKASDKKPAQNNQSTRWTLLKRTAPNHCAIALRERPAAVGDPWGMCSPRPWQDFRNECHLQLPETATLVKDASRHDSPEMPCKVNTCLVLPTLVLLIVGAYMFAHTTDSNCPSACIVWTAERQDLIALCINSCMAQRVLRGYSRQPRCPVVGTTDTHSDCPGASAGQLLRRALRPQ